MKRLILKFYLPPDTRACQGPFGGPPSWVSGQVQAYHEFIRSVDESIKMLSEINAGETEWSTVELTISKRLANIRECISKNRASSSPMPSADPTTTPTRSRLRNEPFSIATGSSSVGLLTPERSYFSPTKIDEKHDRLIDAALKMTGGFRLRFRFLAFSLSLKMKKNQQKVYHTFSLFSFQG